MDRLYANTTFYIRDLSMCRYQRHLYYTTEVVFDLMAFIPILKIPVLNYTNPVYSIYKCARTTTDNMNNESRFT